MEPKINKITEMVNITTIYGSQLTDFSALLAMSILYYGYNSSKGVAKNQEYWRCSKESFPIGSYLFN